MGERQDTGSGRTSLTLSVCTASHTVCGTCPHPQLFILFPCPQGVRRTESRKCLSSPGVKRQGEEGAYKFPSGSLTSLWKSDGFYWVFYSPAPPSGSHLSNSLTLQEGGCAVIIPMTEVRKQRQKHKVDISGLQVMMAGLRCECQWSSCQPLLFRQFMAREPGHRIYAVYMAVETRPLSQTHCSLQKLSQPG